MKFKQLAPITEDRSIIDSIERKILDVLRKEIYFPLLALAEAPDKTIKNDKSELLRALESGRVTYSRGAFRGKFNAQISKELKSYGASWERSTSSWKLNKKELPYDLKAAIQLSEARFLDKMKKLDRRLSQILPEEIARKVAVSKLFDNMLWKLDKDFKKSIAGISVAPQFSEETRRALADEYQNNMELYIRTFAEKEIVALRKKMQANVFAGNRYEDMIGKIQESYGVSRSKAKFLARQESNLLMTKYKSTRYKQAGVLYYKWKTVAGSEAHPVRDTHKVLDNKVFSWDNPPITDNKGNHNHPGEDFNCRCMAIPLVGYKEE